MIFPPLTLSEEKIRGGKITTGTPVAPRLMPVLSLLIPVIVCLFSFYLFP